VFGSQVLSDQFPELFRHGWSLLPYSPDINPVVIPFTATSEIVYITSTQHQELPVDIEAAAEEIAGRMCLTQLTSVWFIYSKLMGMKSSY